MILRHAVGMSDEIRMCFRRWVYGASDEICRVSLGSSGLASFSGCRRRASDELRTNLDDS